MKGANVELFTIGYEGLDDRQFLAYLSRHDIDMVADVRLLPISRKKGFSKTALGEMLARKGIDYQNFRELGAARELRKRLYKSGDYDQFFSAYRDSIPEKTEHLRAILSLIETGRKVSLLCFEREPDKCHRSVVADEIKKLDGNGLKVNHIVPI